MELVLFVVGFAAGVLSVLPFYLRLRRKRDNHLRGLMWADGLSRVDRTVARPPRPNDGTTRVTRMAVRRPRRIVQ